MTKGSHKPSESLFRVSQVLAAPVEMNEKLRTIAEEIVRGLRANWASWVLIDQKGGCISKVITCGVDANRANPPEADTIIQSIKEFNKPITDSPENFLKSIKLFDSLYYTVGQSTGMRFNGLASPLNLDNHILGLLAVARRLERPTFSYENWQVLSTIATQAGLTIHNEFLIELEKKQSERAATLREVARLLNSSLDQQEVLELILNQLDRVINYDSASIMLVSGKKLKIAAHRRLATPDHLTIPGDITTYPHICELLEKRIPVIIPDTQDDPRWIRLPSGNFIRCWLGVPLIGKNENIGLINLDKYEPNYYTQEDAALAMAFANQAAIAIENSRLYSSTQDQINQLNALQETIADISAELELPQLLEAILKRAVKLLNATGGDLGLFNENTNQIEIVISYNMGKDYAGTLMNLGEGAMGLALGSWQPVIVDDYTTWENASPQYRDGPWHAVLAMPFLSGNRVVGAIGIVDKSPSRKFTKSDQHQLGVFAQHAAIAVEKARLYQTAREAAERRAILHQVSQQIVSASLDLEGIYEAIHQAARQLMSADAFVITQYDEIRHTFSDAYLVDKNKRANPKVFSANKGLSAKVINGGQTIYIEDLLEDPHREEYLHFGSAAEVRSILAVPMRLRGKVTGMLSVQSYSPCAYTSEDKYLLEMLASYAAIAIDNASLFFHIQQLATTDSVTGIYNRRHLFDLGRQEFLRARRFNRPLSAIMIDIDHFKKVNDRYGHATGDQVLLKLGRLIRSEIREVDIAGRYGGEEFTIVLPETPLPKAYDVAERLRRKINKTFHSADHSTPEISVSIGVATIQANTQDFSELVNDADMALYAAKAAGRNRVETKPDHKINMASPNE